MNLTNWVETKNYLQTTYYQTIMPEIFNISFDVLWLLVSVVYIVFSPHRTLLHKIFYVYLIIVNILNFIKYSPFSPEQKTWTIYALMIIQNIVLSIFYIRQFPHKSEKITGLTMLSIFLIIAFSVLMLHSRIDYEKAITINMVVTFILLITLAMILLHNHLYQKEKMFFYFNLGLICYMVLVVAATWIHLFLVNIFNNEKIFTPIYHAILLILNTIYIGFIVVNLIKERQQKILK